MTSARGVVCMYCSKFVPSSTGTSVVAVAMGNTVANTKHVKKRGNRVCSIAVGNMC